MADRRPNILFISRRFPPSKGGMERFAADLSEALKLEVDVTPIVWTKQNRWLSVAAIPILFVRAFSKLLTDRSIQIIHTQDAITAVPAWFLAKLFGKPFVSIVNGLDVTYENPLYTNTVLPFVRKANKVIAISRATADAAAAKNIGNLVVIPIGVSTDSPVFGKKPSLDDVGLGELEDKKLLLTVGRLVERKGVRWFINNVLPSLAKKDKDIMYVIAGDGPEMDAINSAIKDKGVEDHVRLLGSVDDPTKLALLGSCTLFIMPNIQVKNDMEGFGIVAQEAALAGLPLVASNLEGIADAVKDGQNGTLVEQRDAGGYEKAVQRLLALPKSELRTIGERAREFTLTEYGWAKVARMYRDLYDAVMTATVQKKTKLKATLAAVVLIITALVAGDYLYTHPHVIEALEHVSALTVLGVLAAYTVAFVGLALVLYYSVRLYGKRVSLDETVLLNSYSSVTNFFGPGQSGSGVRAIYLKVKHGLKIRSFIFSSLIYYAIYSVLSVVMLLAGAGKWAWAIVAAIVAAIISFAVIRLYKRRSKGRKSEEGIVNPAALVGILIGTVLQVTSLAVVYYLEVVSVQHGVSAGQAISYAGGANMSLFIAITPGAIGIREALLVLVQSLHHIGNNTIVAAGVIDRAVYLVYLGLLFIVIGVMHGRSRLSALTTDLRARNRQRVPAADDKR